MDFEDGFAAFQIRLVDGDLAVETTGTQQGRIQNIRAVGGSQYDNTAVSSKTIHFHQQLVQGAFPFIIAHDGVLASCTADGVDLIDEDDTGRLLTCLFEQISYPAGAHPDKQFDK